ncbi:bifunctional hydroxymethylpyrimidine kinase/phosphomethylpyrimidine kinase [Clostridium sp. MB40-C1]|uniref:bifunctional hydroxymethylpyrimidine kinase/phosphomethylpyrimidine kinase n=1 Tax=Clostridium sp. MB40-C1 TaxID=3070996 RepID=UPI0027E1F703|nr:bifunctional hydroxymethylpyrimidine kinase/phosphomethylpyrimidine kinase [Clostridium sp. MB40-C1]WMJ81914.1 bifunctional hydroxymethylpyrimidine kinase/phosphomethylpyrimidine kinase [Clostridium sp. MB40-C1]
MKKVLTIAGSDSCGGAGIQADIKTMSSLGVYAMSVITSVTAQNTRGVFAVQDLDTTIVEAQLKAIFDDIKVDSVKIGMVSTCHTIKTIKNMLCKYELKNIIIDPLMISKSGYYLLKPEAIEELKSLISIADLVTPNIPEAEELSGIKINTEEDMKKAALIIKEYGPRAVLIKGGHKCSDATDLLYFENKFINVEGSRIDSLNTHGTGCTLSSAIASYIALGYSLEKSIYLSKEYINKAIKNSFSIGHGVGPLGHFIDLYEKSDINFEP